MKILSIFSLAIALFAPSVGIAQTEAITLDGVEGLYAPDTVEAGSEIVFRLRLTFPDNTFWGMSNAFRVYSPDGAEWEATHGTWTGTITDSMLPQRFVTHHSVDGLITDTVGFTAVLWDEGSGIPPYFDDTAYTIEIGPIGSEHAGKTICLDSSFCPPSINWQWVSSNVLAPSYRPTWDGPHCFTILEVSCCQLRGDIDHNGVGPDIADYIYLTTYMFQGGPEPPCIEEADVDGSGGYPNIVDRMYLWSYMFNNGPAPVPCP